MTMIYEMPKLPYEMEELAPLMSKETIEYHYGKHLQAYINNLNNLIAGTKFENKPLEEIIKTADGGIFNNAAQTWNHTFFFCSLTPNQGDVPCKLEKAIEDSFGNFENFKEEFTKAAATLFGSGWVWTVLDKKNKLKIIKTSNADNPITNGMKPIMVIDVWEHAYYIDYRNNRAKYIEAIWNLYDWQKITDRL